MVRSIYGTPYFDVTSVYGYAGPLVNIDTLNKEFVDGFHRELDNYFRECNIVSAFARLHPLLVFQEEILKGYGEIVPLNNTVTIDLSLSPMKLIIDEARLFGMSIKLKYLHLGGGVGGVNDSLFYFKSGFSKNYHQFKVWREIINEDVYIHLTKDRFKESSKSSYFPLYRIE